MNRHDKVGQNFYCSLQAMAIPWGQWRRGDPFCVYSKSFLNYTSNAQTAYFRKMVNIPLLTR